MKKFLVIAITILSFICSCSKSDNTESISGGVDMESVFYVSYVCDKMVSDIRVSYTDASGKSFSVPNVAGGNFSRTVGPVKKGFTASFSADTGTGTKIPLRIEVKQDNEPFVVKAEEVNFVKYTIE